MNKSAILLAILSLVSLCAYSQNGKVINKIPDNFYERAFRDYLKQSEYMDQLIYDSDDSDSCLYRLEIKECPSITYFLKDTSSNYFVDLYDDKLIRSYLNSKDTVITLLEISPIRIKNNMVVIDFPYIEYRLKNSELTDRLVGGWTLSYKFACDSNKYTLNNVSTWQVQSEPRTP